MPSRNIFLTLTSFNSVCSSSSSVCSLLNRNLSICYLTWLLERRSVSAGWSTAQTCWRGSRGAGQPGSSETPQREPGESLPPEAETSRWHLLLAIKITHGGQIEIVFNDKHCVQWHESNPLLLVNDLTHYGKVMTHADTEFKDQILYYAIKYYHMLFL